MSTASGDSPTPRGTRGQGSLWDLFDQSLWESDSDLGSSMEGDGNIDMKLAIKAGHLAAVIDLDPDLDLVHVLSEQRQTAIDLDPDYPGTGPGTGEASEHEVAVCEFEAEGGGSITATAMDTWFHTSTSTSPSESADLYTAATEYDELAEPNTTHGLAGAGTAVEERDMSDMDSDVDVDGESVADSLGSGSTILFASRLPTPLLPVAAIPDGDAAAGPPCRARPGRDSDGGLSDEEPFVGSFFRVSIQQYGSREGVWQVVGRGQWVERRP